MMAEKHLEKKITEIAPTMEKFFALQHYFQKKELLLNESSVGAVQALIDRSSKILAELQTSIATSGMGNEVVARKMYSDAYDNLHGNFENAKISLKEDFRKVIDG